MQRVLPEDLRAHQAGHQQGEQSAAGNLDAALRDDPAGIAQPGVSFQCYRPGITAAACLNLPVAAVMAATTLFASAPNIVVSFFSTASRSAG